jgi:class 3 adenylate cyclase
MDIGDWLRSLGLGKYEAAFRENEIDETVLPNLTGEDLKELGVASLGHRRKLLDAIAALRTDADLKELGISSPGDRKRLLAGIAEKGLAAPTNTVRISAFSEGERRQVTILFADLCGFTALSQSLDPEEVVELVGRYTALVDGVVVGYGATVDKHIGDAVMALFGAPRAHDDNPMRAARAALDIHEALAQLSETASRPLQAHVGIANGEVVAGSVGRIWNSVIV